MSSGNADRIAIVKQSISGLGEGMEWANVAAKEDIFCSPNKLPLDVANYIDIIDREIKAAGLTLKQDTPVGLILLNGLRHTFPCKTGK